ncbi:MAG TPA: M23 family metallopeptidase [Reyranella sp.]|nr:M23 family metallopeptidase [Reyranella sp.]
MTDFPPPSDPPKTAKSAAFALFRPVLFAAAAIGLTLGALVLFQRTQPTPAPDVQIARSPAAGPLILPPPDSPPPVTMSEFQGFQMKRPEGQAAAEPPASDRYELTLRLEKGDTIEKMLADIDVPEADRKQIDEAMSALLKKRKLVVGETITLQMQTLPDQPDAPRVLSLSVRPQPEREFLITRRDEGSYSGEEKIYKVSPRIVRVEGIRHGSLQQSGVAAGAPSAAMIEFIRALSYDVDFQRELKENTKFTVLLEQLVTSDGKVTHPGRLLAGELVLLKRVVTVVRYRPAGGADGFWTPQGESVVRSFLRTPMDASHITSGFGWREHPILGYSAMHTGIDFGAPMGTPILAAGNGKVMMAGVNGGYGLYVKLQHTADLGTGYGHMSRLGPGIKPGVMVRQGQVIGFVGATGMATGPHLHYEFYRGGHPVNPLTQKASMRAALGGKDLAQFKALSVRYLQQMKNAPHPADVAPEAKGPDGKSAEAKPRPPQIAIGGE